MSADIRKGYDLALIEIFTDRHPPMMPPREYMFRGGEVMERSENAIRIFVPKKVGWTGEGQPPVGTHLEWLSEQYGWLGGRVVGYDGEALSVVSHNDGYTGCHSHEIRPIRTHEQIAAEEREKSIAEMCEVTGDKITIRSAEALYDAGYRKFEIVENEE